MRMKLKNEYLRQPLNLIKENIQRVHNFDLKNFERIDINIDEFKSKTQVFQINLDYKHKKITLLIFCFQFQNPSR